MPFVVTTTHTIPDDAPVTADMLSDVLRPSRWAGLPDGTATTARVDFVPARSGEMKPDLAGGSLDPDTLKRFDHSLAESAARAIRNREVAALKAVDLHFREPGAVRVKVTGDTSSFAVTVESDQPSLGFPLGPLGSAAAKPGPTNHRHPSDPRRRYGD